MRVLIIGHNVFSKTNNMGKTMLSYFRDFKPDETAQFYIQNKYPSDGSICQNYFQFTDKDAVRSIISLKNQGRIFGPGDIRPINNQHTSSTGVVNTVYQYGRKRNAVIYSARNFLWNIAHWKTKKFLSWVKSFDPDVVFFMSGDYGFMYKIALFVVDHFQKPLVVDCVDDYYLFNKNDDSWLGRIQQKRYMKVVHRLMSKASCILTISDSMKDVYHDLFQKPCFTLHTSAVRKNLTIKPDASHVAYFGNLGFKRREQLIEIGRAIKSLQLPGIGGIDVYSGETNPVYFEGLTEENGVSFHGKIDPDEVSDKMSECIAVIHTESFDPLVRGKIKYSVSTKIAESMMYAPCLIAYGPEELASIDYLKKNNAAYVITNSEDLERGLREILTDEELRSEIVANARKLAVKNHDEAVNPKKVREWLQMAVDEQGVGLNEVQRDNTCV